jgi:hypothetical protein
VSDVPTSEPNPALPDGPLYAGSFLTGPDFAARMTRAQFSVVIFRPTRIVLWCLLLGLVLVLLVGNVVNGEPLWVPVIAALALVAMFALPWLIVYPVAVRSVRRQLPTGSKYSLELRTDTFTVQTPLVKSEMAYSLFVMRPSGHGFLALRQSASRTSRLLPLELFTDESRRYFESRINRAG